MRRFEFLFLLTVSVLCIALSGPLLQGQGPEQPDPSVQEKDLRNLELDRQLQEIASRNQLPGFGVAIVSKNAVLFQKGYGYADVEKKTPYTPHSLQYIASVSKTFIGVSLMQLVEQGKVKLDDDINVYLPFKVINPYFPEDPITIRHLATHTSTLSDPITNSFWKTYVLEDKVRIKREDLARHGIDVAWRLDLILKPGNKRMPMGQFIRNIFAKKGAWYSNNNFLNQKPGTTYQYSNLGADLAAYIVERASGETYAEYTKKHILEPLGMTHSGWSFDDIDRTRYVSQYLLDMKLPRFSFVTYADGGLITSIEDMSKYVMEMISGYQGESKLLKEQSFLEMMAPQSKTLHGIFWAFSSDGFNRHGGGDRLIGHGGGDFGIRTLVFFDSVTGRGMIVFTNYSPPDYSEKDDPANLQFNEAWRALDAFNQSIGK